MSELGSYLKQVREEKMITLDDLQRTTKIQKRYLVAIEEGNFDTLPGIFFMPERSLRPMQRQLVLMPMK